MSFAAHIETLERGEALAPEQVEDSFALLMDGHASHEHTKRFLSLTVPYMRDAAWIAAGAKAMRARMLRIQAPEGAIDVCGTGGDGSGSVNVSTCASFIVAGAGVPVAKHGNRAMSSKCGAADVLEELGVKLTGDAPTLERALREAKVTFLFAQNHHPAMRHVGPARRELGHRTIFNLLGPLSNPAGVTRQLLGVFSADFIDPVAEALRTLGAERAWVVHGFGGLDELSGEGENQIAQLQGAAIKKFTRSASDAYLSVVKNEALRGGDAKHNALAMRQLLACDDIGSDYAEVVLLNAAAALVAAGRTNDLAAASKIAQDSLMSGAALQALERLIAITRNAPEAA
jgi:anthranilate phosphoribosyltransferase